MAEQNSKGKYNGTDRGEQLQSLFFSKDCISGLNKVLLQQNNLNNLNRDGKQEVINILVKNMKTVYRSLDLSKISNTNFDSIYKQFKEHSVKQSLSEIKQTNLLASYSQLASELKFQRDFNSNPNTGNKFLDRPEASKHFNPSSLNQKVASIEQRRNEQRKMNDPFSDFVPNSDSGNYESSLDQAFKPIVDNIEENNAFNTYSTGRTGDVNDKMDEIQQMRQTELAQRNNRPPTPDFLKPIKSNPDKNDNSRNTGKTNQVQTRGGKPDFKNLDSNNFNQGFKGLANDVGEDLYSLDNIDKPLVEAEIIEDQTNFEDRLKRLQSERDNLKPTAQQKSVNFTDDNFPNSDMGTNNVPKQEPKQRTELIRQAEEAKEAKRKELIRQAEEAKKKELIRQELIRQAEEAKRKELISHSEEDRPKSRNQSISYESPSPSRPNGPNNKFNSLKNSMKSMNIEIKEDTQQLKQLVAKLSNENNELRDIIEKQKQQLERASENSELDKIIEIKKQIAEEFETLRIKNDDIETKINTINLKDIELSKKESEVKKLIENYDYLFRTRQMQIEVSDNENQSKYTWSMDMISNVTGIKLMSYSLPEPKFNIEEYKNNFLHINVNNDDIKVVIPTGKYNIDDLIFIINDEINKQNSNIKLSLNKQQKVIINSKVETDMINILPTQLSQYNLGFTENVNSSFTHTADKIWDLRIDDKVYLYLTNLSEEVPFGLLYLNGKSVSQFKFQKPFNMDHLDILFKDSKGNQYNFYDLAHNLSFIVEKFD